MGIVEQNRTETDAKVKASRQPKTIKVVVLWQFIGTIILTSIIVSFVSIVINNAINDNINTQVDEAKAQLKESK